MPFFKDEHELSNERKVTILIFILFLHLILISSQITLKSERTLLATTITAIISPLQIAVHNTINTVSQWLQNYVFLKNTYRKHQELREEHLELKLKHYRLQRLLFDFRAREGLKKDLPSFVMANVIALDRNFPLHSMTIDRGSSRGIRENNMVLNRDGELVGKIVHPIVPFSATVRLITSPIGGAGAYLEENLMEGFISGDNSPICTFKYLLENKPVSIGARIITSGTDGIFSPYIPIGKVVGIERDYLTQIIKVKPFFVEKPLKHLVVILDDDPKK